MKLTVYESPEAVEDVYPEYKLVYLIWKIGDDGPAFRDPVKKPIDAAREHGLVYFLK